MPPELDLATLHKLDQLDTAAAERIRRHVAAYRTQVRIARRNGHNHPESVARAPKLDALKALQAAGFDPIEAVAAFQHLAHQPEETRT